jgi:hypothetical protein
MRRRDQIALNEPRRPRSGAEPERKVRHEEEIIFADDNAKTAWEVGRALEKLARDLPPEGDNLQAAFISFEPEHKAKGTYAVLLAGTVVYTDRTGVYMVPERTIEALDALGIPYRVESA